MGTGGVGQLWMCLSAAPGRGDCLFAEEWGEWMEGVRRAGVSWQETFLMDQLNGAVALGLNFL